MSNYPQPTRIRVCSGALALLVATAVHAAVQVRVQPTPLILNEAAQLAIISDGDMAQLVPIPKVAGVAWLSNRPQVSTSMQVVNGRQSRTVTSIYGFRPTKAGTLVIPPLQIRVGRKVEALPRTVCQVLERQFNTKGGEKLKMEDLAFAEVRFAGQTKAPESIYVGQELPLRITAFVHKQLLPSRGGITYPEVEIENVIFRDFSQETPETPNPKFRLAEGRQRILNKMPFVYVDFDAVISALGPGTASGRATIQCSLVVDQQRSRRTPGGFFDDSFFSDFFGRSAARRYQLEVDIPEIKVLPLPPSPKGQQFLGLIGEWTVEAGLKPDSVRLGEPTTLAVTAEGAGNVEQLLPPELELADFRIYEPEIKKERTGNVGRVEINWAVVPLRLDSQLPKLMFSTFSPSRGVYVPHECQLSLDVQPAQVPDVGSVVSDAGGQPTTQEPLANRERQAATDILYIHTELAPYVRRPLWSNVTHVAVPLSILSPILFLASTVYARRRERLLGSESLRRRQSAQGRRSRVFRALKKCSRDQLPETIREQLVPTLSAALDMPPGTTASQLAERVSDEAPELADALRSAEQMNFMPGQTREIDVATILRQAGTFFLVCVVAFAASAGAQVAESATPVISLDVAVPAESASPDAVMARAREAYDREQVEEALRLYESLDWEDHENAALLYNRANCHYRLGDLGRAAALYERARRVAPRNSDIIENLNFVRREMDLPPVLPAGNPAELAVSAREQLRPDEWLLFGAVMAFVWGLGASALRLCGKRSRALHITCAVCLVVAFLASATQVQTTYRPDSQGAIVDRHPDLHQLPSSDTDEIEHFMKQGDTVTVVEQRTDWLRIRMDDSEGWIPASQVEMIW